MKASCCAQCVADQISSQLGIGAEPVDRLHQSGHAGFIHDKRTGVLAEESRQMAVMWGVRQYRSSADQVFNGLRGEDRLPFLLRKRYIESMG
jgi:hypothetical protein